MFPSIATYLKKQSNVNYDDLVITMSTSTYLRIAAPRTFLLSRSGIGAGLVVAYPIGGSTRRKWNGLAAHILLTASGPSHHRRGGDCLGNLAIALVSH